MTTDITGFIARDCAADRVPLPGDLVHDTGRWLVGAPAGLALTPPHGPRDVPSPLCSIP
jgi:hypothetical protein